MDATIWIEFKTELKNCFWVHIKTMGKALLLLSSKQFLFSMVCLMEDETTGTIYFPIVTIWDKERVG